MYQTIDAASDIEQRLPAWLKPTIFTRSLWKWFVLVTAVPLVFLFGSLVAWFLKLLSMVIASRILGHNDITQKSLVTPVRLILLGLSSLLCAGYSDTLLRRTFWHDIGNVLVVFGATWLSMKIIANAT